MTPGEYIKSYWIFFIDYIIYLPAMYDGKLINDIIYVFKVTIRPEELRIT